MCKNQFYNYNVITAKKLTDNFSLLDLSDEIISLLCFFVAVSGKQEFKGRNKKKTLSIRDKAQSRRSSGTIQVNYSLQTGFR